MKPGAPGLAEDGYTLAPAVLSPEAIATLAAALARPPASDARRERKGETYAVRHLLSLPEVRELAASPAVRSLVEPALGPGAFPVRGLLLDKTPAANWKVPWHQDLTIAVRERIDTPGFTSWSVKAGVPHVQPPPEILARMMSVRLHLDPCGEENGPLWVIPGSHVAGRLSPEEIDRWRQERSAVACPAPRGAALLMRPLLLHASFPAKAPGYRRVIHLEFAAEALPNGLQWHR